MQPTAPHDHTSRPDQVVPQQKKSSALIYVLVAVGGLLLLVCGGCFTGLVFIGAVGPDTAAYKGRGIPQRFLTVAEEVGGLEAGETVHYFYSDAVLDVKNGFSYVSDRKVVVYSLADTPPLIAVPFEAIQNVTLERDESFVTDSIIMLETEDSFIRFPVSSEKNRDVGFYEAIRRQSPNLGQVQDAER